MMRDFVDVEGEFSLHVLMLAFRIADMKSGIFARSFGNSLWNCEIFVACCVPDGIADVVRESPDGKGQFVSVVCIAQEINDEVSRADVVCQVKEMTVSPKG